MPEEKKSKRGRKSSKVVPIIMAVVLVLVLAAVIVWVVLAIRAKKIESPIELRQAMADERAINCTISEEGHDDEVWQASKGWGKIKKATRQVHGENVAEQTVMVLKDDFAYIWDSTGNMAYKTRDNSMLDQDIKDLDARLQKDEAKITVKCDAAGLANFGVPGDISFAEIGGGNN